MHTFKLNDRIVLAEDTSGWRERAQHVRAIGPGVIIGRTYTWPRTYDVRLDNGQLIIDVAATRLTSAVQR